MLTSSLASNSKGKDGEGEIRLGWKGAYVRFGNTETGLLKLVKGRGKWSPSGATAAAVAGEEEEAEEEGPSNHMLRIAYRRLSGGA